MMKRVLWTWTVAVLLAVLACPCWGQPLERGPAWRERAASGPVAERAKHMDRVLKELNLSDEQKRQVQQILETHGQALRNWRRENWVRLGDLHKQIEQAKEAEDSEKLQTLRAEIEKIEQSRKALFLNLQKQLKDALKPEQFEKVRKSIENVPPIRQEHPGIVVLEKLLVELKLSDAQKKEARAIFDEAKKQADAVTDPEQKKRIRAAAIEKVRKEVLTPEQIAAADRIEVMHRLLETFGRLNLSDDQKQQVREIMDQAREQAQKAGGEQERRKIFQQAFKKINDTVLTADQRAKLKEIGKGRPRDWRKRDGRGIDREPVKPRPGNGKASDSNVPG